MFKRISKALVCFTLAISMTFGTVAFAQEDYRKYDFAKEQRYQLVEAMVRCANRQIDFIVDTCIATRYDDAHYAVMVSDQIAKSTIQIGGQLGVTVVCEYEQVIIDGHTVLIDPIKVIRF